MLSSSDWTAERIDLLVALWADGKSQSAIAEQLSNGAVFSRSAIAGQITRLRKQGIPLQARSHVPAYPRVRRPKMSAEERLVLKRERNRAYYTRKRGGSVRVRARHEFPPSDQIAMSEEDGFPDKLVPLTKHESWMCAACKQVEPWDKERPNSLTFGYCTRRKLGLNAWCGVHLLKYTNPRARQ